MPTQSSSLAGAPVPVTGEQLGIRQLDMKCADLAVEADHVAVAHPGQGTANGALGSEVDRRGDLAGGTRHPAVGDQRDAVPAVLQHAQQRRELVQFGHPVGPRTLVAHDDDDVAFQFAAGERLHDLRLVIEHPSRRRDHPMRRRDRRHLDHRAAEVPSQNAQAAVGGEGVGDRAQHLRVETFGRSGSPNQ